MLWSFWFSLAAISLALAVGVSECSGHQRDRRESTAGRAHQPSDPGRLNYINGRVAYSPGVEQSAVADGPAAPLVSSIRLSV